MTDQIQLWHLVLLLIAFFGACGFAINVFLGYSNRDQDARMATLNATIQANHANLTKRLDGIESTSKEDANNWKRIERELLGLKADLPQQYVRRDDYIQATATINAKLDAMALRFENILLKGQNREH